MHNLTLAGGARPTPAATPSAKQHVAGAGTEQKKLDRNALSACGDSARATAGSQAHDRELDSQELSSLCSAARAIADEVVMAEATRRGLVIDNLSVGSRFPGSERALIIDGRELQEHRMRVLTGSRAAQLLEKDRRGFGVTVKQLYLSGPTGGAGLRELLAYRTESMETDQPEFNLGRPAPASASGSAIPTSGRARAMLRANAPAGPREGAARVTRPH